MPTYTLGGITVQFPHDAYDCQLVYMERVICALKQGRNALLESPTGTGKTLCLLCATLAWRDSLASSAQSGTQSTQQAGRAGSSKPEFNQLHPDSSLELLNPRLPTIVYSSRTHSQLQQVIRELKATVYRPKMVVLGSREQMCIHSEVQSIRGRAQNHACRSLTKGRSCAHYNRVADYVKAHPNLGEEPIDIEDLVTIGRTEGPCPYFLSRELHNTADILFVPYNYLIEKENRRSLSGISWANTILIFDEAHNLEGICADAASFDLPAAHLTACIGEAKQCVDLALARRGSDNAADTSIDPDNFAVLKALLMELQKKISEIPIDSSDLGFTRPGPYIYEFLADMKITYETVTMLIDTIDQATTLLEDEATTGAGGGKQRSNTGTMYRLQALRDALRIIFRDNNVSHAPYYRVHVHEPSNRDGVKGAQKGGKGARVLSWWCFNPGIAMEEFSKMGVRSVILTSGTLAPLDSFASELNLPFHVRLENPHVIDANQIWVGVVSMGPSGRPLNSSYRTRESLEYKLELGNTIVNFARIVPDGLLVFFPSYYLLNSCIEAWQTPTSAAVARMSTVWERICKHKQPVVEPRESALFNQANADFCSKVNDPTSSGAIFFAVCRGKVSEGLDFADRIGRAVVVTGIPFAMKMDPKVRLKREYLDEQRLQASNHKVLKGEEWYVHQAARAVNQAVGRVIRHRHDYGAIILCDERFGQAGSQSQMSLWLRPHIKCYSKFGDAAFTLTRFFRDKAAAGGSCKPSITPAITPDAPAVAQPLISTYRETKTCISLPSGDPLKFFRTDHLHVSQCTTSGATNESHGGSVHSGKSTGPLGPLISPRYPGTTGPTLPRESLSAMLAASRQSRGSQPLSLAITPANCAVGSTAGVVHVVETSAAMKGSLCSSKRNLRPNLHGRIDEVGTASSSQAVAVSQKSSPLFTCSTGSSSLCCEANMVSIGNGDTRSCGNEPSRKVTTDCSECKGEQITAGKSLPVASTSVGIHGWKSNSGNDGGSVSINCKNGSVLTSDTQAKDMLLANSVGSLGADPTDVVFKEERKKRNAAEFLKQVKAHLSVGEYKGFLECMRGLKSQSMSMNKLLELIANLFSAPERLFLLCSFGDFVPNHHRHLYDELMAAKHAEHGLLPGESPISQTGSKPSLLGFPSRSRKVPITKRPAGCEPAEGVPPKQGRTVSPTGMQLREASPHKKSSKHQ